MGRTTVRTAAFVLAAAAFASPALAQFNLFPWTFQSGPTGGGTTVGDQMTIVGPDGAMCSGGSTAKFTATAPYAATVYAEAKFQDNDKFPFAGLDHPVVLVNGVELVLHDKLSTFTVVFDVPAGASFGFGVHSKDCFLGEGILTLTGLRFLPRSQTLAVSGGALESFGSAVAGPGDVNGDGVGDVLVGAPLNDASATNAGRVTVFSGATGAVLYAFGGTTGDHLGWAAAAAGDLSGDGVGDLAVGAPYSDAGGADAGAVRVHSGATGAFLFIAPGATPNERFGTAIGSVGDFDADGTDDLIVGAPLHDGVGVDSGAARVISGANGSVLATVLGAAAGDQAGAAADGAGDFDADGVLDILVGSPLADPNFTQSGSARVVSGASGAILATFSGNSQFDQLGTAVAGIGDVNGDGLADVAIGAPFDDSDQRGGIVRVYGGPAANLLLDLDGGGGYASLGFALDGPGDVDGDGRDDVLAGAPAISSQPHPGSYRVFSGRDGGVIDAGCAATKDDRMGHAVAGVGDVNGDGRPDVAAGAPFPGQTGFVRVHAPRPIYTDLGFGTAGIDGVPHLLGQGLLAPGTGLTIAVVDAKPAAPAAVVVGLTPVGLPFGGTTLVPSPDVVITGLATNGQGLLKLLALWPAGVPSGFEFWLQGIVADPAGPQGLAVSNALRVTTP